MTSLKTAAEAKNSNLPAKNQSSISNLDKKIIAAIEKYYPVAKKTKLHKLFGENFMEQYRAYVRVGYVYPDEGRFYCKERTIMECTDCVADIILQLAKLPMTSECFEKIKEHIKDKVRREYRIILRNNQAWYIHFLIYNEIHDTRKVFDDSVEDFSAHVSREQIALFDEKLGSGAWDCLAEEVIDLVDELFAYATFDKGEDAPLEDIKRKVTSLVRGEDPEDCFEDFLFEYDIESMYNELDEEEKLEIHNIAMLGYEYFAGYRIEDLIYEEECDREKKDIS